MDNMEITQNKMTLEEVIDMLNAKISCINNEISGTNEMCNNGCCVDCSLCYEQGTMSEQKEALKIAIQALEQDTVPFDFELYQAGLMDLPTEIRSIVATVLDDIKKKIEVLNPVDYVSISSYEGHKGARDIKDDILQIIDEYKNGELLNGEMDKNSPTARR